MFIRHTTRSHRLSKKINARAVYQYPIVSALEIHCHTYQPMVACFYGNRGSVDLWKDVGIVSNVAFPIISYAACVLF